MAELVVLTRHSVCPHDCPSACSLCVSVAVGSWTWRAILGIPSPRG